MNVEDLDDDDAQALADQIGAHLDPGSYGDRVMLTKRQLMGLATGTLGTGALLSLGVDEAAAQAAGSVGTSSDPVDIFGYNLEVSNQLDMLGNDIVNAGSIDAVEIPSGAIVMWSGSTTDIPGGWTLCDGTDGAPDLTDRFVVGAGGQYTSGDTGGTDSVTLTESEMPSHTHTGTFEMTDPITTDDNTPGETTYRQKNDQPTDTAGGGEPHENRPPYYALAFIYKL